MYIRTSKSHTKQKKKYGKRTSTIEKEQIGIEMEIKRWHRKKGAN